MSNNPHFSIENTQNFVTVTGIQNLSPECIYIDPDSGRILIVGCKPPRRVQVDTDGAWLNVVMYHPDFPDSGFKVPISDRWSTVEFVLAPANTVVRIAQKGS